MACVSRRAMVSNSLIVAARSRVSARKTARLISATSAFSTASTSVSCVFAAWSCSSLAVSSLPKGAILLKFISRSCVISWAKSSSGARPRSTLLPSCTSCTFPAPQPACAARPSEERRTSWQKSSGAACSLHAACWSSAALLQLCWSFSWKIVELLTRSLRASTSTGAGSNTLTALVAAANAAAARTATLDIIGGGSERGLVRAGRKVQGVQGP
mmetsp:Transcript_24445/g.75562  ORF Transcript_24445/g.75562 Transcript_24445/m.75562 type:complete len:214 (-) Transcript_24445:2-643(-)